MTRSIRWTALTVVLVFPAACEDEAEQCAQTPGTVCVLAGTGEAGLGAEDVRAIQSELYLPQDVTVDHASLPYVLDWNNHRIRVVEDGLIRTVIGTGSLGDAPDGYGTDVSLNHPTHVSVAADGKVIIAAWHNSKILRYDPASEAIETICGDGSRSYAGDGGPATAALLDLPVATAFGPDGSLYITDQANQRIRRIDPEGIIDTWAGTGVAGFSGDGGPADQAEISMPKGQSAPPAGRIATDAAGNLYLADSGNHRIRKVTADGIITTVAGNGMPARGGDGGPAIEASLSRPSDVAVAADGTLYIADTDNSCIRRVTTNGIIDTVLGRCGSPGRAGVGGPADGAGVDRPYGVEVDAAGNLYVADTHNHRILVVWAE